MNRSEDILAHREQGQLHVSIGTSLALEGALGIYPEHEVSPAPLLEYNQLWINLATMFRNLFGSLTAVDQDQVTAKDLTIALASEIPIVEAVVAEAAGRKVHVVFYVNDMKDVGKWFPNASIKKPTTNKQRIYQAIRDDVLKQLPSYLDDGDFRLFHGKIQGEGRTLILTHSAIDLLSYPSFDSLVLLESHTGKIKPRNQWGSKLGCKDETLPLNTFTLQVFGDGSLYLSPLSIKYRRAVLGLAKHDRWSPVTTKEKIRVGLATVKDAEIRKRLLDLYATTLF